MNVYIRADARNELSSSDIWYHCGGCNEEGDSYDTQMYYFEQELDQFWATVIGPAEYLRSKIRDCLYGIVEDWKRITFEEDETLKILYKDGTEKVYTS